MVSLDGETHYLVEQLGLVENGEPKSPVFFSADRLVTISKGELKVSKDRVATSGGPMARIPLSAN